MPGTHVGVIYGIGDNKIHRIIVPEDASTLSDRRHLSAGEAIKIITASSYRLCNSEAQVAALVGLAPS